VLCAPGNAGIAEDAECLPEVAAEDVEAIVAAAKRHRVDLVAIGPEAALVAGAVDALPPPQAATIRLAMPSSPASRVRRILAVGSVRM
jgi:phosphoribosylamine--glycine ligase